MKTLNDEQENAVQKLIQWKNGTSMQAVLHGKAGCGKTFTVEELLARIPNVKPLLLADTNEAVGVITTATKNKYPSTTICKALGLVLSHEKQHKKLVQRKPPDLSEYNLLVVDEASQPDLNKIEKLEEPGIPVLYIGDKDQLPPCIDNLAADDPCISPVFLRGYLTYNLTKNMRNKGELADFCNEAAYLVNNRGMLSDRFAVRNAFYADFLQTDKRDTFLNGETVVLAYTNNCTKIHNNLIRAAIYGKNVPDFVKEDLLVCRSVVAGFEHSLQFNVKATTISNAFTSKGNEAIILPVNTKAKVVEVYDVEICGIPCYEITAFVFNEKKTLKFYASIFEQELEQFKAKLYKAALYDHNPTSSDRKWKLYHDASMLFGDIRHAYAMTVHCAQGSTKHTVFVDDANITSCENPFLRKKLRSVAYSRASTNLHRLT